MNISLKDLKKNGGTKKEFTFLKPLLDVIKVEYKELYEKFSTSNLGDALTELKKDGKIPALAVYHTVDTIRITKCDPDVYHNVKKGETFETAKYADKFSLELTSLNNLVSYFDNGTDCYGYKNITLKDVYVVTDLGAAEEAALNIMIEEEKEAIKKAAKRAEKNRTKMVATNKLRATYGIEGDLEDSDRKVIELLEALSGNDAKVKFTALKKVVDTNNYDRW